MNAVLIAGGVGVKQPPLYQTGKGFIGKLMLNDAEIEQLRIEAIRRCDAVSQDLAKLQTRPVTMAMFLAGADAQRKLLVETVDFDAIESIEKAMDRLETLLGSDGVVADPRPMHSAIVSMACARIEVDALTAMAQPYREMLAELKKAKK